jgi:hypothetical protein
LSGKTLPDITKHYQTLPNITKHYQTLPNITKHDIHWNNINDIHWNNIMGSVCSGHNLVEVKTLTDKMRSAVYYLHKFENKYRWVIGL